MSHPIVMSIVASMAASVNGSGNGTASASIAAATLHTHRARTADHGPQTVRIYSAQVHVSARTADHRPQTPELVLDAVWHLTWSICVYIYTCIHIYTYIHMHVYLHMCTCMHCTCIEVQFPGGIAPQFQNLTTSFEIHIFVVF
jgi:hypothetical protein